MSKARDLDLQAKIAAMERELAELRKQQASVISFGSGMAFAGDRNFVNTGSIGGGVQVIYGNIYNGPPTTDPAEALRIYCQVLVAGSRYLPLRGVDVGAADPSAGQKTLNLAHVYIALDTRTSVPIADKDARRKDALRLPDEAKTRPLPALEAAGINASLVLLGDPGSGKSTFVMHLAHCLAAHRADPVGGWLDHLAGWPEPAAVPIVVVLRDVARWYAARVAEFEAAHKPKPQATPGLLWDFISERLAAQKLEFAAEPLRQALERGKALVLYDGLDEIAGRVRASTVRDVVAAFAGRYGRSRHLVTCRMLSYQQGKDWKLPDFPTVELAPFDAEKIGSFVAAWYAELAAQGTVHQEDVAGHVRSLNEALCRPDLWRLAPNPLLLTVMALVHTHKGRLPDARALLYEETVDILLWRWEQIKAGGTADETPQLRQLLLQANRGDVDLKRILWRLAFEAHGQGGARDDGEKLADIGELRLLKELSGLCCGDLGWAQQVVEAMKLRAGLLVERQGEVFTFPHRTFQEYLAGAHLATQADFARRAAGLVVEGAHWREVITLAAGKLVYLSGDLDKPLALTAELCPGKAYDTDLAWRKAWLAGDVLVEMGAGRAQDTELGRELLARVRDRLAELLTFGRLGAVERARAGDTLGRLGDPRPGVALRPDGLPDIAWCEVPAGEFIMGNTQQTDDMAYDNEAPQHAAIIREPYRISKYPITNAQFEAFVQDGGYTDRWRQCWTRAGWRWKGNRSAPDRHGGVYDLPNHPAVMITWYEAAAFCSWLGEKLGLAVTLPSEAQWEEAARGVDDRTYPWGEQITPEHANYDQTGIGTTSAVGIFPKGASPCDALDMSGNVWEWCRTKWQKYYRGRPDEDLEGSDTRVLRGGAFVGLAWDVRCAYRLGELPLSRNWNVGFRVAASPSYS